MPGNSQNGGASQRSGPYSGNPFSQSTAASQRDVHRQMFETLAVDGMIAGVPLEQVLADFEARAPKADESSDLELLSESEQVLNSPAAWNPPVQPNAPAKEVGTTASFGTGTGKTMFSFGANAGSQFSNPHHLFGNAKSFFTDSSSATSVFAPKNNTFVAPPLTATNLGQFMKQAPAQAAKTHKSTPGGASSAVGNAKPNEPRRHVAKAAAPKEQMNSVGLAGLIRGVNGNKPAAEKTTSKTKPQVLNDTPLYNPFGPGMLAPEDDPEYEGGLTPKFGGPLYLPLPPMCEIAVPPQCVELNEKNRGGEHAGVYYVFSCELQDKEHKAYMKRHDMESDIVQDAVRDCLRDLKHLKEEGKRMSRRQRKAMYDEIRAKYALKFVETRFVEGDFNHMDKWDAKMVRKAVVAEIRGWKTDKIKRFAEKGLMEARVAGCRPGQSELLTWDNLMEIAEHYMTCDVPGSP